MQLIPTHSAEQPFIALPEAFADLQPFTAHWAKGSETARNIQRHAATMDDIVAFKDAILGRFDDILAYLNARDVNTLDASDTLLLQLLLSLAEIAPAVESYGQPEVIDGFDPRRFVAMEDFSMKPKY